jgi:hypothetical protein
MQIGWKTVLRSRAALARGERVSIDAIYADDYPSSFGPGCAEAV